MKGQTTHITLTTIPSDILILPRIIMGRKRKRAKETTALGIIPVYYTKLDFEERNKTILDFAEAIRSRNHDANQRELSKDEVAEQFALAVFQEYAATEPTYFELLGQVSVDQIPTSGCVRD